MKNIVAVTVTYGERLHLLEAAVASLIREGCARVIVVNNGSCCAISELSARYGGAMQIVSMPANMGSAMGFKAGLEAALASKMQYVFLLDDDNLVHPGTMAALQAAHSTASQQTEKDNLIVLGYRPDHQPSIGDGTPLKYMRPHPDSFFGFHVAEMPFKLRKRFGGVAQSDMTLASQPKRIALDFAPYSGMFFHRALLERHGLPDTRLVLYGDDTEFSYRVSRSGGKIWLIPGARLTDQEPSWNVGSNRQTAMSSWMRSGSDLRVYYASRNQAYFEKYCRKHSSLMRSLNRAVYFLFLRILASYTGSMSRYSLFARAVRDGERKILDVNPAFPLF